MAEAAMTNTGPTGQPGPLSVVSTTVDGIRRVPLAGEIDHHTGDTLRQALDASTTALSASTPSPTAGKPSTKPSATDASAAASPWAGRRRPA